MTLDEMADTFVVEDGASAADIDALLATVAALEAEVRSLRPLLAERRRYEQADVLIAHAAGALTEGQAAELLGVDVLEVREEIRCASRAVARAWAAHRTGRE